MLSYRRADVYMYSPYEPVTTTLDNKNLAVTKADIPPNTTHIEPFDYIPPEIIRHILSYIDDALNVLLLGDRIDMHDVRRIVWRTTHLRTERPKTIIVTHGLSLHIFREGICLAHKQRVYGTETQNSRITVVDGRVEVCWGRRIEFVEHGVHSGNILHESIRYDIDRPYRKDDLVEDWRREWKERKKYPLIYECSVGDTEYYRTTMPRDAIIDLSVDECPHESLPKYFAYGELFSKLISVDDDGMVEKSSDILDLLTRKTR